ncbi:hypothetical protein [Profundibacter sp.]
METVVIETGPTDQKVSAIATVVMPARPPVSHKAATAGRPAPLRYPAKSETPTRNGNPSMSRRSTSIRLWEIPANFPMISTATSTAIDAVIVRIRYRRSTGRMLPFAPRATVRVSTISSPYREKIIEKCKTDRANAKAPISETPFSLAMITLRASPPKAAAALARKAAIKLTGRAAIFIATAYPKATNHRKTWLAPTRKREVEE